MKQIMSMNLYAKKCLFLLQTYIVKAIYSTSAKLPYVGVYYLVYDFMYKSKKNCVLGFPLQNCLKNAILIQQFNTRKSRPLLEI